MLRETRDAITDYLDSMSQIEICVFVDGPNRWTGGEVQQFLRGSEVPQ